MSHSIFSPSASSRWINCPGSINLIRELPAMPEQKNGAAFRGTVAHKILEEMVKRDDNDVLKIADELSFKHLELDWQKITLAYVLLKRLEKEYGKPIVERRVSFRNAPEIFGTIDYIFQVGNRINIVDFKFGFQPVKAERNSQALLYALMFLNEEKFHGQIIEEVKISIIQPKVRKTIDTWTVTQEELKEFNLRIKQIYTDVLDMNAGFKRGEYCKYCPAELVCPLV